jgi:hypothetical protein
VHDSIRTDGRLRKVFCQPRKSVSALLRRPKPAGFGIGFQFEELVDFDHYAKGHQILAVISGQALIDDPGGKAADSTPCSSQVLQARFSRLITRKKNTLPARHRVAITSRKRRRPRSAEWCLFPMRSLQMSAQGFFDGFQNVPKKTTEVPLYEGIYKLVG